MTEHNHRAETPEELARLRLDAIRIFQAGVAAADPYHAVKRALHSDGEKVEIVLNPEKGGAEVRTAPWTKIRLVAFGKAACAMAFAAQEVVPSRLLAGRGIAVTNYENRTEVENFECLAAGHPLPDANGQDGARRIAERVAQAKAGELVLVLVSGGGSALIPFPPETIALEEKIATTQLLLACGADIAQINCVRKHLSRLKGGGLARLAAPADLHALILSDVLGDDLSSIASGPSVPDATTFADAIEVFRSRNVWEKVPVNVRRHLESGRDGKIPETPKPGDPLFERIGHTLIGGNRLSVDAIAGAAEEKGYEAKLYSTSLCGEARAEAEKLVRYAKAAANGHTFGKPLAIVAGGETTVTLKGNGRGGRNQEMALAFAVSAREQGLGGNWVFLSGGTDGRDGPTDAAGGIVDPWSLDRMAQAGVDPVERLNDNDSYTALKSARDLLETGATGTNVADLQVLLIGSQA